MAYIKNASQAAIYCKFRPSPPKELIDKVISFLKVEETKPLHCAVDVGCGSGQSSEILAPYFQRVIGIDNSEDQLQEALKNNKWNNVLYRRGSAERLEESDGSVDLVSAGMAVHWFDLDRFSAEVGRVLRPGGVLALYGYYLPRPTVGTTCLADTVKSMLTDTLGDYFPDESKLIYFDGYKGSQFSKFSFSKQPSFWFEFPLIKEKANINDLLGYISSTSSFQNFLQKHGEGDAEQLLEDFKIRVAEKLQAAHNLDEIVMDITFPYVLLLNRKDN